ncbi:hypothetical protein QUF76_13930 [Desulfobacterales bacterium HSG16]|nr:hypothetical protein [Desulfobacterales bacterium HSG16]
MAADVMYDSIYAFEGWGKKMGLARGKCMLKIIDISKMSRNDLVYFKPIIAIVSDLKNGPDSGFGKVTVKSIFSHIATCVTRDFNIDHSRIMWIEHCPALKYGLDEKIIPERFDIVDFVWKEEGAIHPRRRQLKPPMLDIVKNLA